MGTSRTMDMVARSSSTRVALTSCCGYRRHRPAHLHTATYLVLLQNHDVEMRGTDMHA